MKIGDWIWTKLEVKRKMTSVHDEIGDWMWTELEVKQKMTSVHKYGIDYKRVRGRTRKRENGLNQMIGLNRKGGR
jgi:hypothetical protein